MTHVEHPFSVDWKRVLESVCARYRSERESLELTDSESSLVRKELPGLLLDPDRRNAHITLVEQIREQTSQARARDWKEMDEETLDFEPTEFDFWPGELMPIPLVERCLEEGFDGLSNRTLAQLLLNSTALDELARCIVEFPSELWLDVLEKVGRSWAEGVRSTLPPTQATKTAGEVPFFQTGYVDVIDLPNPDTWDRLPLGGKDSQPASEFAERAFGDSNQRFSLVLLSNPADGRLECGLEMTPAPSRDRCSLEVEFPNGECRTFILKTGPVSTSEANPRECYLTGVCAPLELTSLDLSATPIWQQHGDTIRLVLR